MREAWMSVLGNMQKDSRVCSDHFAASDILYRPSGIKYLRKGAIPAVAGSSRY